MRYSYMSAAHGLLKFYSQPVGLLEIYLCLTAKISCEVCFYGNVLKLAFDGKGSLAGPGSQLVRKRQLNSCFWLTGPITVGRILASKGNEIVITFTFPRFHCKQLRPSVANDYLRFSGCQCYKASSSNLRSLADPNGSTTHFLSLIWLLNERE